MELELMHEVSEEEIEAIAQTTALFTQPDKLDYMALTDIDTALA